MSRTLLLRLTGCALFSACLLWTQTAATDGGRVEPGVLPRSWLIAGPRCMEVPDWQVHEYNENLFILRQSGCTHFEKPFLYLFFGEDRAALYDTGAGEPETAKIVFSVIGKWLARNKRESIPLTVFHSHGHSDHIAGDSQFQNLDGVTFIAAEIPDIQKAFGVAAWPADIGSLDLGGRKLDVIPVPGHQDAAIALYDARTGLLLSGDNLYPGRLSVRDWPAYAASTRRLVDFTAGRVVAHVLGTHIEQTRQSFFDYPRGTIYQPDEAPLELSHGDLLELNAGLEAAGSEPKLLAFAKFTVIPRSSGPSDEERRRISQEHVDRQIARKWDQTQ
jgi:glyoxylase-like metal-dependent hydrolase (beta-lactamase superfamily II)